MPHGDRSQEPEPSQRSSWTPPDVRAALHLTTVADAAHATQARHDFAAWLSADVDGEVRDDIVLAVYEALANAAEHAYAGAPTGAGTMWLTAHRGPADLQVTVTDHGRWRPDTGEPFRSRGLVLMRKLLREVDLTTDHDGTVLHLRAALPRVPARPSAEDLPA